MDKTLEEKAAKITQSFSRSIGGNPASYSQFLRGLDFLTGDSYEIIIVNGKDTKSAARMSKKISDYFIPNKVIILSGDNEEIPEFIRGLRAVDGRTTVYVCKNYHCKLPTTSMNEMLRLLDLK